MLSTTHRLLGTLIACAIAASAALAQPRLKAVVIVPQVTPEVLAAAAPPGDDDRLFLGHGSGRVSILDLRTGQILPQPFLPAPAGVTRLIGLAFDPSYPVNGHFYLNVIHQSQNLGRIVRFTVSQDPNVADPQSGYEILATPDPGGEHHGGWIEFGLDGYLYASTGDSETAAHAQNLGNLYGKILRLDVRTQPYSIPPTNPFFGSTTARPEIWAYGLRNPWRCSIDRATGDLWIGDVGDSRFEEVNYRAAPTTPPFEAVNYGWPGGKGPQQTTGTPAIHAVPHASGRYIVGGYVYRGAAIPWLRGAYIFTGAEGCWSLRYDGTQVYDLTDWTSQVITGSPSFATDGRGEIYGIDFTRITRIEPRCWANCDGSPMLDLADFGCFQTRFALGDPYADCNGDGLRNLSDFGCFQTKFALGCP